MSQETVIDFAIIGGGILGLYLAHELKKAHPKADIVLFEKSAFLGDQTTGRNSGVLHAGIYYKHNSLKHRLCIEGHQIWKQTDAKIANCGKFIFAQNKNETSKIEEIFQNALINEVPNIQMATERQLIDLRKDVRAEAALYSPWTSIIDVPDFIKKLNDRCTNLGVMILRNHDIQNIIKESDGYSFTAQNERIKTKFIFNCAGLHAVAIRKSLGLLDVDDYWVKGHYLTTNEKLHQSALLYPAPEPHLKGLGVHSTYDFAHNLKFGPDTHEVTELDYTFSHSSFEQMKQNIKQVFPRINTEKLREDYVGIRPKIKYQGNLYEDFWIKKPLENYIEMLGIESPGLTAAPAIVKLALSLL